MNLGSALWLYEFRVVSCRSAYVVRDGEAREVVDCFEELDELISFSPLPECFPSQ